MKGMELEVCIKLAKTAGFCFGVNRAIDIAMDCKNGGVYTLGPLIHNKQVVAELEKQGIVQADSAESIPKDSTVIIRSHGVSKAINDILLSRGLDVIDATCPFVKKIHKIVQEHYNKDYAIVIFGDEHHPEVIGINGWCNNSAAVYSNIPSEINVAGPICVVAQTTASEKLWINFKIFLNNTCKDVVFFDTICNATEERQREAEKISRTVDTMIVIGGYESSNTMKLSDLCKTHCPDTYHIETVCELPEAAYKYKRRIGVTAGASTPEWIIKEVINKMSEEKMNTVENELSFAEQLDQTMITLKSGDIVKGTVIGISPTEVYVNLGFKADGTIPLDELSSEPVANAEEILKIGDEVEVFVVRVNDVEGTVKLSMRKLEQIAGWKKLEASLESQEVLEGKVTEVVNGGLIVSSNGSRVFIPASQASTRFLEDLSTMLGEAVKFRVIDINPKRRKLVGSIKSVAGEVRKQLHDAFWADVEVGKIYTGKVKTVMDFGVFIDVGGADGLLHISEMSWKRIKHPSELLKVGDSIEVFIKSIDSEKKKISLGYKKDEDNPWKIAAETLNVGDVVKCKIVRLVPFGAFAEIMPMVDGLIHISQIANQRIPNPSSVLSIGQEVEAKIVEIDFEKQKISLSIKVLLPDYIEEVPKVQVEETQAESEAADEAKEEITEE